MRYSHTFHLKWDHCFSFYTVINACYATFNVVVKSLKTRDATKAKRMQWFISYLGFDMTSLNSETLETAKYHTWIKYVTKDSFYEDDEWCCPPEGLNIDWGYCYYDSKIRHIKLLIFYARYLCELAPFARSSTKTVTLLLCF